MGFFFFNHHLLSAQTTVTDSTADSVKVQMQLKVVSIFKTNCSTAGCHRGDHPKKNLNLEPDKFLLSIINVASQEINTQKRVDTTDPEKSYLLMKIRGDKGIKGSRMPDGGPSLKKEDIKTIQDWIFSMKESHPEKVKNPTSPDSTKNIINKK
jgi:hypothetical protein